MKKGLTEELRCGKGCEEEAEVPVDCCTSDITSILIHGCQVLYEAREVWHPAETEVAILKTDPVAFDNGAGEHSFCDDS